jgi:hypothetical protein
MRVLVLLLLISLAAPAGAQGTAAGPAVPAATQSAGDDLPVSLDRIREQLARPAGDSILDSLERKPDFTVQVEEQARIDAIISKLDFSSSPAPAGGLYMYEQQQRLFSSTRPLQRPYAAFSGGELLTIALQNVVGRYIASRVSRAGASAREARAEREAREEVEREIAMFCASRPDRDSIRLCTDSPGR